MTDVVPPGGSEPSGKRNKRPVDYWKVAQALVRVGIELASYWRCNGLAVIGKAVVTALRLAADHFRKRSR